MDQTAEVKKGTGDKRSKKIGIIASRPFKRTKNQ
jgi:hypothetical protein